VTIQGRLAGRFGIIQKNKVSCYATSAAFERLYRELAPKLVSYLVANGSDYALAGDIAQETFLRLWNRRDELADDAGQISGLAFTVAKNLRTDGWRRAQHETAVEEVPETPVAPAASPSDATYLRQRLQQAFAELPPLLREAYTLFQVMELSIREIALRTNTTEANVKVRIFRAKEKLRPLLADVI